MKGSESGAGIPLVVMMGPTAAGKSAIAAGVAQKLGGEIVCADSRQIYAGMEIGSAQPSAEERAAAPHHLYGVADPKEPWTAGSYRDAARPAIEAVSHRGRLPMAVGGTGLYVRALLSEWSLAPPASGATVDEVRAALERRGSVAMWEELAGKDPRAAGKIHRNDAYRIVRALAIMRDTGRPPSEVMGRGECPYRPLARIAVGLPRPELYERINRRCEAMMRDGLLAEAAALRAAGVRGDSPAAKAIGYRELFAVLEGRMKEAEAVSRMQAASRQYAKRQLTWMRGQEGYLWIDGQNRERAIGDAIRVIRKEMASGV